MPGQPDLKDIQAWLHAFVVTTGDQRAALAVAESKAGFDKGSADALILPSPTLSPTERVQIYRGMYLLRMQEALEIDFSVVSSYVGGQEFQGLVAEYVARFPSRSYTLDHLGRDFARFLSREEGAALGELAALEWSLCVVGIAKDSPALAMSDLAAVPEDHLLSVRFEPIIALERHRFLYNVNDVYKAWSDQQGAVRLTRSPGNLVCWRHQLEVWRMELHDAAYCFLDHLCRGTPLGESIELTQNSHDVADDLLFRWFHNWTREGFFASFSTGESPFCDALAPRG